MGITSGDCLNRYHSGYGFNQWETTFYCYVISHWLSPHSEWFMFNTVNSWCLTFISLKTRRHFLHYWLFAWGIQRLPEDSQHKGPEVGETFPHHGIIMWFNNTGQHYFNSLWPSDAIWQQRSGSTLAQVMTCCLTAPSHYLNQCWLIISKVQWHSSECNFTRDTSATSHWN